MTKTSTTFKSDNLCKDCFGSGIGTVCPAIDCEHEHKCKACNGTGKRRLVK